MGYGWARRRDTASKGLLLHTQRLATEIIENTRPPARGRGRQPADWESATHVRSSNQAAPLVSRACCTLNNHATKLNSTH